MSYRGGSRKQNPEVHIQDRVKSKYDSVWYEPMNQGLNYVEYLKKYKIRLFKN